MKNDARYKRTEELIREAYLSLISHSPLISITVTKICHEAAISRNAFYAHYSGISDLYEHIISEFAETTRMACRESNRMILSGSYSLEEVAAYGLKQLSPHEGALHTLLSVDDGRLAKRLAEVVGAEMLRPDIDSHGHNEDVYYRAAVSYVSHGLVGFISYWVQHTEADLQDFVNIYARIHGSGLRTVAELAFEGEQGEARNVSYSKSFNPDST